MWDRLIPACQVLGGDPSCQGGSGKRNTAISINFGQSGVRAGKGKRKCVLNMEAVYSKWNLDLSCGYIQPSQSACILRRSTDGLSGHI